MSSACSSGEPHRPHRTHFGSVLSVATVIISLGLESLASPPIQASSLRTCCSSTSHYVDHPPVVIAAFSTAIFTLIVYLSSFLTSACLGLFEQGVSEGSYIFSYYFYPIDTFKELVSSTLSILNDEFGIIEHRDGPRHSSQHPPAPLSTKPDTLIVRLVKKFILGLPLVGIGSLIQMILSMPILGPVHWIARYRSSRGRRASTRDMTAIIVVGLMVIGALRFVYQPLHPQSQIIQRLPFSTGLSPRFTASPKSSPNNYSFEPKTSSLKSAEGGRQTPLPCIILPIRTLFIRSCATILRTALPLNCPVLSNIGSKSLHHLRSYATVVGVHCPRPAPLPSFDTRRRSAFNDR